MWDTGSRALAVTLVAALCATGCSLLTKDFDECSVDADCRAAFGFGNLCNDDGRCELVPANPRCNRSFPEDLLSNGIAYTDTIVVGNLMDRSFNTHRARENAARLAIKQASEAGGIDGRGFGIVFCTIEEDAEFDSLSRTEAAVASAAHLIEDLGVPAIIGPAGSNDTQAVFQSLDDGSALVISPSATSVALTDIDNINPTDDNPGLLWRTAAPDSLQGAAIAYDMTAPGPGRVAAVTDVAVIFEEGAYGTALTEVFAENFQAAGGTVTLLPFDSGGSLSEKIAQAGVGSFQEVLFVSSQISDAVAFLDSAAANSGYDGKSLFLTDAAANADFLADADPARFPMVRGTRPAGRDPFDLVLASFSAAYLSEYGDDVTSFSFATNAYDAAWLVTYGSAWSLLQEGSLTATGIARGLRRLSSGTAFETRSTAWIPIVERFRSGESIDIAGTSGELDYDPATEETETNIETWVITGGAIEGVGLWPPAQ